MSLWDRHALLDALELGGGEFLSGLFTEEEVNMGRDGEWCGLVWDKGLVGCELVWDEGLGGCGLVWDENLSGVYGGRLP